MKLPQFNIRTLLLLTAAMGVIFVACAKWPVRHTAWMPGEFTSFVSGGVRAQLMKEIQISRPPTPAEWSVRVAVATLAVGAVCAVRGAQRARKRRTRANPQLATHQPPSK
jgi:hypothetical protein